MLLHFFNLRAEVNEFLKTHNKPKLLVSMQVEVFHQCLACLVDIFGSINEVNTKMQVDKKAPSTSLLTDIKHHLNSLIAEFERYFPKLDLKTEQLMSLTRGPFRRNVHEIPEQLQEEFLELTNNSALKGATNRALLGSGPKIVSQHKPGRFQDAHTTCFHISLRVSIFSNANHKEQI
ncbi:uncharacterized protein [Watersipora subatra]|uniref:uncharacterized protein n=1 Tax=Watersipora subatra TaxID=2589382 RepID=UPI00355C0FEB